MKGKIIEIIRKIKGNTKRDEILDENNSIAIEDSGVAFIKRIYTLYISKKIVGNSKLTIYSNNFSKIQLSFDEEPFDSETHEHKISCSAYIATNRGAFYTFAHYKMTSLDVCELNFSKRIYSNQDIKELSDDKYKSFLQEFINRNTIF